MECERVVGDEAVCREERERERGEREDESLSVAEGPHSWRLRDDVACPQGQAARRSGSSLSSLGCMQSGRATRRNRQERRSRRARPRSRSRRCSSLRQSFSCSGRWHLAISVDLARRFPCTRLHSMSLSVDPVAVVRRERGDPCARGEAALTDLRPSNPLRISGRRSTPSCTQCGTSAGLAACRSGEQCRGARAGEERASAVRRRDVGQHCPPTVAQSTSRSSTELTRHRRNVPCSVRSENSTTKRGVERDLRATATACASKRGKRSGSLIDEPVCNA